jgi:RNA polymerase sigma-70 factor (ECF subfamily)
MTDSVSGAIDWTAALQQHRPWLMKVLRCRVGDAHVAEDLLQNIALAVVKQSAKPDDPSKVAAWLYRLAVRQTINHHRKSHRRMQTLVAPDDQSERSNSNPLEWIMAKEKQGEIRKALHQLKPQDQEILALKYTENWTYQELAEHLGVKVNTVEYRLMKARKKLRTLLTKTAIMPIKNAK